MAQPLDAYIDPDTGDLPAIPRLCTGVELVQQRIRVRLQRGTGEWFLDPNNVGLPLLDWRQQKPLDAAGIARRVEQEIGRIPGVVRTSDFSGSFDAAARRITVTGQVYVDLTTAIAVVAVTSTDARNTMSFSLYFSSGTLRGGIPRPSIGRP